MATFNHRKNAPETESDTSGSSGKRGTGAMMTAGPQDRGASGQCAQHGWSKGIGKHVNPHGAKKSSEANKKNFKILIYSTMLGQVNAEVTSTFLFSEATIQANLRLKFPQKQATWHNVTQKLKSWRQTRASSKMPYMFQLALMFDL